MALHDEVKEQHKKLKDMTLPEKAGYIYEYYKFHILAAVFLAAAAASLIHAAATKKEQAFYAAAVNSAYYFEDAAPLMDDFLKYADIDPGDEEYFLETSYRIDLEAQDPASFASMQKLLAMFQSKKIDILLADEPVIENYAQVEAFADLRDVLPEALIAQAEDEGGLYYTESGGERIPVAFYVKDSEAIRAHGLYGEDAEPLMAVSGVCAHPQTAALFLEFLLSGREGTR